MPSSHRGTLGGLAYSANHSVQLVLAVAAAGLTAIVIVEQFTTRQLVPPKLTADEAPS